MVEQSIQAVFGLGIAEILHNLERLYGGNVNHHGVFGRLVPDAKRVRGEIDCELVLEIFHHLRTILAQLFQGPR